jgi:hypothetical protein
MGLFIGNKPFTDASGAQIFRYGRGMNCIAVLCAVVLPIAAILDPPTALADMAIAALLIGSAIYISIHTAMYRLVLRINMAHRHSPRPWHRQDSFNINETSAIEIHYRELYASIKMRTGTELRAPILLIGAYQLLRAAMDGSDAAVPGNVRAAIERFTWAAALPVPGAQGQELIGNMCTGAM